MSLGLERCSLLAVCLLGLLLQQLSVCQAEAPSKRLVYNKTCRYAAYNVSRDLFFNGQYEGMSYAFPLETGHAASSYGKPWQACFGPADSQQLQSYQNGQKLPCFYRVNRWGTIDYWEEHACDVLLKANCYCYALNRYMGSYCEPGLGGTGQSFKLPILDCESSVAGIVADGAKPISRQRAYALQGRGWVIALAVKPGTSLEDTGDFHFWRLEPDGTWAYKAGDTLSRNTLRNGTKIRDVESPVVRGGYTEFCGYFQVWPETHKLRGNDYWYSNLPSRLTNWRNLGVKYTTTPLARMSEGWSVAYRSYFWDAGWEDLQPVVSLDRLESARLPARPKAPHWQSIKHPRQRK